jgi:hypothetical protein
MDRRRRVMEELGPAETCITLPAVGVQDPELGLPIRRAITVAGDGHLRPLADDVSAEAEPVATLELESQGRRFGDCPGEGRGQSRRLEDDQPGLRSPGKGGEPSQPIGEPARPAFSCRQIEDEQIDRPCREE